MSAGQHSSSDELASDTVEVDDAHGLPAAELHPDLLLALSLLGAFEELPAWPALEY